MSTINTTNIALRTLAGLALAAGTLATSSVADADNYRRNFVPDYDQVRGAIFDIEGLPNNGNMYCVPTAAMNWMTYIAKRGFPFVPPSDGDYGPDATTDEYNELTGWLEVLGTEMGTNPTGGTGGEGAQDGIEAFLESGAPGKFFTVRTYVSDDYCPPPSVLSFHALTGGLVLQRIGWYEQVSGVNSFNRTGGHVVTLNGLNDYETSQPTMRWRDPGSDEGNMFFQSDFTTNSSDTLKIDGTFDGLPRTQYMLTGYTGPAFIDGYIAIRPKFGLLPNFPQNNFDLMTPEPVTPDSPILTTFQMPPGTTLDDLTIGWDATRAIATSSDPASGMSSFYSFDLDQPQQPVLIGLLLPAVQQVREAPNGNLIVLTNGQVHEYEIDDRTQQATLIAATTGVDPVVDFDLQGSTIAALRVSSTGTAEIEFVEVGGGVSMLVPLPLPTGALGTSALQICNDGSPAIFIGAMGHFYSYDALGRLVLAESVDFGALVGETGAIDEVQMMDNGDVIFSIGGTMHAAAGHEAWIEILSVFKGQSASTGWVIADNATNFKAGVHDTPAYNDVFPTEFPGATNDCPWDLDGDGQTTFGDLNIVLGNWGHVGFVEDPGDCTGDGNVNFDDLNEVLSHWGEFCN